MADNNLPYEYQSQIIAAERRKALAEALQKQAFGFQGSQGTGRIVPKTSPLTWLANTATGYLASEGLNKADEKRASVLQQAEKDRSAEMLALMQAPEDQQPSLGIQGKFPQTQALAGELYKRKEAKIKAVADLLKERDTTGALRTQMTGQLPGADHQLPGVKAAEEGKLADGTPYIRDFNLKGEGTTRLNRPGTQITNVIPKAENALGVSVLEAGLKPREDAAAAAKNVISSTNRAVDALSRGALAGGGEELKQGLRKAIQAFGVTPGATAETEELKMALGSAILTEAAKIKPISNTDIETLRSIVGSINTDPNALTRALAFMQAESIRGLQNFNKYVSEQGATVSDPIAKQRLAGVTIGSELPPRLFGPDAFQMSVMQALQQGGGDISAYTNTRKGPNGQTQTAPFEPDAVFNIQNPAATFSAAGAEKPAAFTPPPGWSALTPEQQARYKQLKGIK